MCLKSVLPTRPYPTPDSLRKALPERFISCTSFPLFPVLTRGFISDARKMEDYLVNTSKEKLDELSKKLSLAENDIQIHIRSGNIRDEVTKLADELKADVVIVGSRNPNIQTHLLGSEAAGIVRYAHVPVFVVR
jgi:universal stress protein G